MTTLLRALLADARHEVMSDYRCNDVVSFLREVYIPADPWLVISTASAMQQVIAMKRKS